MTQPPSNPDPYDLVPKPPADKPDGGLGFAAKLYTPPPLRVRYDLACVHCGYNLRGLSREGHCPECHTPIADSYQGDFLQFSRSAWVGRLAIGSILVALACILNGLTLLAALFAWPSAIFLKLGLTGATLDLLGSLLLASREPRLIDTRQRLLTGLKLACIAAFFLSAITMFNMVFKFTWAPLLPVLLGVAIVKVALLGTRLHILAQRIPNGSLAAHSLNLTWVAAIILAASIPATYFGFDLIFCTLPIGILIPPCLLWAIFMLVIFANDFRHCAREAKRHAASTKQDGPDKDNIV